MKAILINICLLLFVWGVLGQNVERFYITHIEKEQQLDVVTNEGKYIIKSYSDKIIETTFIPRGESFTSESHAVIAKPQRNNFKITENSAYLDCIFEGISVMIIKKPFQISYYYKGELLTSERLGFIQKDSTQTLDFNVTEDEVLYGGGARALGMNRRGNRLELYNRAHYGYEERSELMNFTMPLVLSSKKYALHFDNPAIGFLDLDSKKDNSIQYETISGRKTYQLIVGDTWYDLVEQYTYLTGRQPLPPRWALGNFASRFGYRTESETRQVVADFAKYEIPLDAVILDLYWFGKEMKDSMGNLEFDEDSFPNYGKMISDFNKKGIKTILITEPFILTSSKKWDEAVQHKILATDKKGAPFTYDFFFGNTGLIDIFKPEAREWFWDIYKKFTQEGVGGWWGDLGEPEVHPKELQHHIGSANEVHNIYGHYWAKLLAEGYVKDFPNQRPFILMRAGYSGSQRFGLIPWSGDVSRTWGGLTSQPEIALQMGMQGLSYMHSDLGGFAGDNLDDELYVRWLQYGVYQPIFRPHAQEEVPSEPVYRSEYARNLAKQAIEQRYRLLPYNYTLAYENTKFGKPLMRPLFFEESDNEKLAEYSKAYLWGDSFLVAPVLKSNVTQQEVYFPKGNNWIDIHTLEKYSGGTAQEVLVDDTHIPVFVRGGSFIPTINNILNTKEYSTEKLIVHYYYDNAATQTTNIMYEDDGITPNTEAEQKFEILRFESFLQEGFVDIRITSEPAKNYTPINRTIELIVTNLPSKPRDIRVDGSTIRKHWDKKTKKAHLPISLEGGKTTEVRIRL
jgi:oligosaccharide 4-alpha-D-glucosyltransferase